MSVAYTTAGEKRRGYPDRGRGRQGWHGRGRGRVDQKVGDDPWRGRDQYRHLCPWLDLRLWCTALPGGQADNKRASPEHRGDTSGAALAPGCRCAPGPRRYQRADGREGRARKVETASLAPAPAKASDPVGTVR